MVTLWRTIKIKDETYKELLKMCAILQIQQEKKVGIDEAIQTLMNSAEMVSITLNEMGKKGD